MKLTHLLLLAAKSRIWLKHSVHCLISSSHLQNVDVNIITVIIDYSFIINTNVIPIVTISTIPLQDSVSP